MKDFKTRISIIFKVILFIVFIQIYQLSLLSTGGYNYSIFSSNAAFASESLATAIYDVMPCFNITCITKTRKAQLNWAPVEGTQRYDVYRAEASDPYNFQKIGETVSSYASYTDITVINNTTYLYIVGALNSAGTWCYSNVDSGQPAAIDRTATELPNYSPVIYSPPVSLGTETILYKYNVKATDPNKDTLIYSLTESPEGMNIDSGTGLISWIPSQPGDYQTTVKISDGNGGVAEQTFSILVAALPTLNPLPPDPGEAGKETLLGIDSDNDGVRDDIQRYIYFTYPNEKKVRLALTQIAKDYQTMLPDSGDREKSYENVNKLHRSLSCLYYIKGGVRNAAKIQNALQAEILNTKERSIAYFQFSDSLAGKTIEGIPFEERKNCCLFNLEEVGAQQ